MKRFEYKVCFPDRRWGYGRVNIDKLNEYGENGWEAVGVLGDDERVLLKREIQ